MVKYRDCVLSLKTSKALDTECFGLSQREETKRTQLIGQFLEEYFWNAKSITSGGRAEGTALDTSSDSDVMGVIGGIVVVDNDHDIVKNMICISAVRTERFPGYCKLKLQAGQYRKLMSDRYTPIKQKLNYEGIKKSIVYSNEYYISSKLFCENVIPDGMKPGESFNDIPYERNGPATRNNNIDYVRAFEMNKWPREAKNWITRSRKNEWPSKVLMKRLEENMSCYVVAIGNKASADFDMEWRLSFVEIERELIWNMNETQFKCLVLLKRLKEYYFGRYPALRDITTYHIKNVLFWMCEELPQNKWIPRNLIKCVKRCLQVLQKYVKNRKLNHFIIPENNLFQGKTFVNNEIQQAIKKLQTSELYELIREICLTGNEKQNHLLISPEATGYRNTCHCMWGYCETRYDPDFCSIFLEKFPKDAGILLPCVQIAQAKVKWREELREMARRKETFCSDTSRLPKSVVNEIKEGREMDFSTSSINAAIVYFMHGNNKEVLTELKPLVSNNTWKIYPSTLGGPMYLRFKTGEMHDKRKENVLNVQDLNIDRINLVSDFWTTYEDIYSIENKYVCTLPYPLALQLCLTSKRDRRNRYNPVVICYYLMFMSQLKLGDLTALIDTKEHLEKAVRNNEGRKDYYMSLVLLGHCLYWTGDIESAFKYFAKSMNVEKSVRTVAVYHMAFLINDWTRYNK